MDILKEIICDSIEALLLLEIFGILNNQKKFVIENKIKAILFCILYNIANYWSTFYVPIVYHTLFLTVFSILLITYITKIRFFASVVIYFIFFTLIFITETVTEIIEMVVLKVNLYQIAINSKYLFYLIIVSKMLQILIVAIFLKFNFSLIKSKLFQKEGSLFSNLILQMGVFGLFIFGVNVGVVGIKNTAIYNILIFIIYLIFFIIGIIDFKERERIMKINNDYKIQVHQIENMEEIINIIRQEKHDYANHINVIQGLCCLNKPNTVERIKDYVSKISDTIHSSFRYLDTGNDYIDGLLSIKSNYAMKNKIDFKVIINEPFSYLKIREDEMISIISNIIDNAFEAFTSNSYTYKKEITISTFIKHERFCIEIADNGEVIPKDIRTKIFEKGFSTKTKQKGEHGYGLFITKQLVEQNNGIIYVESNPEKTKFLFEFVI